MTGRLLFSGFSRCFSPLFSRFFLLSGRRVRLQLEIRSALFAPMMAPFGRGAITDTISWVSRAKVLPIDRVGFQADFILNLLPQALGMRLA